MSEGQKRRVVVAAVQLQPQIADVDANLKSSEVLADEAGERGAEWIVLPEFFTTGMAFDRRIVDGIQPADGGPALRLMLSLAQRHRAYVGGSFIMRDADRVVRNAFYLVSPNGVVGRHDKDIPTMWENNFYVGGTDDGVIRMGDKTVGVALCWEFMRSQTARRLRGKVDLVVGGSTWWSVPAWPPRGLTARWERENEATAHESVRVFATYVGAPIVHAANVGPFRSKLPWLPWRYEGHFEGGAMIVDAKGRVVAMRDRHQGPGVVVAEIDVGRTPPRADVPRRYWLHRRGPLPTFAWNYQRLHGRLWHKRHVADGAQGAGE